MTDRILKWRGNAMTRKINRVNIVTLLSMLLILCNSGKIISDDEPEQDADSQVENVSDESEVKPYKTSTKIAVASSKKNLPKDNVTKNSSAKKLLRSERKLFINGQDSPISIIVTDKDNKLHHYTIPAGITKSIDHVPLHIKKIVCKGNYQYKDISITGSALNSYSVFIFTIDNKLEQMHFIDIKQKTEALNRAKNALRHAQIAVQRDKSVIEKLAKKFEEIQEQTIYLQ